MNESMNHSPLITSVDVVVTNPMQAPLGNFVLVRIATDQDGLYGWGDATCSGSELAVAAMIEEHLSPALLGKPAGKIEHIWHTLYHLPYYRSGSVHLSAISGIDMALWDIKGKLANLPVCELLGGPIRDRMLTYRSVSGRTFDDVLERVRELQQVGHRVVKVQAAVPELESGYAVPSTSSQQTATDKAFSLGVPPTETWEPELYTRMLPRLFDFLRNELGDSVELIHDVHERITPSQALRLANDLSPYNLFYLEDLLRPEHLDTFRLVRSQSSIPLAMGEVFCNPWEGQELWLDHLIDYVRHDLAHVGGITAGRKIAATCESRGILTAWHGPGNISPLTHMANAHLSLSVPNFGIQEFAANWAHRIEQVFTAVPLYDDGHVSVPLSPGLGCDIDIAAAQQFPYVRRMRPTICREDGTPWAY